MNDLKTAQRLAVAIGQATRSAKFCVADCLGVVDPGLDVEGMGRIKFPLSRAAAKALVALCRVAPYGKGSRTLVDTKVRKTFELDPAEFRLSDAWNSAVADATRTVAEQLGLPDQQLEARLYKLLVYEPGGFFLPHRDSEKHHRMVASLVVVLPNRFEGGMLVVRHGAAKEKLSFAEAAAGRAPCYAAFYADCEHEVRRVSSGLRLCLTYNLVLKPTRARRRTGAPPSAPADLLAGPIGSWFAAQPARPLVFALEHHYTRRGLSLDLLKGGDRQLADLVVSAAEKTNCLVHLAQVSRHLVQYADDGSFGRGYARHDRRPRSAIEIGETYEDELKGTQWTDIRGRKQPWGEIAFELSAIVSSQPIDDWKPTSEEYEGYTGNAGNTLDRWYHRSAIVCWQRDYHFDVIASSGVDDSIPLFCSMTAKLAKTAKKRLEAARLECVRFAHAIVAQWPHRPIGYQPIATPERSQYEDFAEHLLKLDDRNVIAAFLSKMAQEDQALQLRSLVVGACRTFGWSAFAQELKCLISPQPHKSGRQEIPLRDVEWLSAFCCDKTVDADKTNLGQELCALAIERFCEPIAPRPEYYSPWHQRRTSVSEASLPLLVKALAANGRDEDLSQVIHFAVQSPDEFSLDNCQVPSLKSLIPWSRKQFGSVPPQLASWLAAVRQQLELATAKAPTRPTDWARPAEVACTCQYCAQLKAFLADPASEIGRIAAREDRRQHLIGMIARHQCDVTHALERKGSPHSLVLQKTTGSFERAVQQFEMNCRLLSSLPPNC